MQHGRKDYQERIVDLLPPEQGGIPHDEPVFLLRGQDVTAAQVVKFWAALAQSEGDAPRVVTDARQVAAAMEAWPVKKTPDSPAT